MGQHDNNSNKKNPKPVFDWRKKPRDDRGQGDADQGEVVELVEIQKSERRQSLSENAWKRMNEMLG